MSGVAHQALDGARCRLVVGGASIVVGTCLVTFGAFVHARGVPGECGGDAVPCPPGTATGSLGMALAIFLLLPAGAVLAARRRPEMALAAAGLPFAGVAAAVFTSRFVADPITTSTRTTWWFVGVCGTTAAVLLAIALLLVLRRQSAGAHEQEPG